MGGGYERERSRYSKSHLLVKLPSYRWGQGDLHSTKGTNIQSRRHDHLKAELT